MILSDPWHTHLHESRQLPVSKVFGEWHAAQILYSMFDPKNCARQYFQFYGIEGSWPVLNSVSLWSHGSSSTTVQMGSLALLQVNGLDRWRAREGRRGEERREKEVLERGSERERREDREGDGAVPTWSGFRPVKQNMPIWSVMCCQFLLLPSLTNPSRSRVLMSIILSAIPLSSTSLEMKPRWRTTTRFEGWLRTPVSRGLHWPLLIEFRVVHHSDGETSSADRWVRVHGPDQDLQLWHDTRRFFLVLTDHGKRSHSLACPVTEY